MYIPILNEQTSHIIIKNPVILAVSTIDFTSLFLLSFCSFASLKFLNTLKYIRELTDEDKRLSKYQACQYLNISRSSFDNYVREGKLPRGKHVAGFKELGWFKKDLDKFIKDCKR